jgi:hemerythrin
MPLLNWYDRYSINNIQLDNHHKKLFALFNRLYDICLVDNRDSMFETALDEIVSYSDYHFKAEEQYMREIGYNDIEKQIVEHKYFKERAIDLQLNSKSTDYKLCHEIIIFLGNWLMNHVIEEDKKIAL